jgi:hypothetical protein
MAALCHVARALFFNVRHIFPSWEGLEVGFRLVAEGLTHPGLRPPLPKRGYFSPVSLTRIQL